MSFSAGHKLLFGIIALQMDFIRREQLVTAVSIWLLDKSRGLDVILQEQGALNEEVCELLAPLVERHIKNHDGDPQRSLAALSSIGEVADELRALGDENIDKTLSIVASDQSDDAPQETAVYVSKASHAANDRSSDPADARFRILRSHARGGLGEVYVAKDTELNREVALKEIQTKFADDEASRLRFLLEAEVTGGLEHPGIVPVYGLGRYEDGRPFYAMRFIKGDSLQEAADRFHERVPSKDEGDANANQAVEYDGLEFRKLLARFIDVCQAIEYAHSRGVLHRDLKPGNIMLGNYGETLVVDWGLAKAQGSLDDNRVASDEATLRPASASGSAPTMMGSAIGTPAFMPPEQAAGELDNLGPASDVYSLGATLYYLLTGRPPISGKDLTEVLSNVKSGNFPSPPTIRPLIPKALTAICLKAMAIRPSDRYASPNELAEDVERFLADESVRAFREPISMRARRWARKHPAVSAATVAVVLLSAIGLGLFSTVLRNKNAELAGLVASLQESNSRETKARNLAEANERSAQEQSRLAYSTLYSVVGDLQLGLRDVPGAGEARRSMLKTALPNLDAIATKFVSAANVDLETAWVLINLGDLALELGADQEPGRDDTDGDATPLSPVELAAKLYDQSLAIAKQLVESNPDNGQAHGRLALAYERVAGIAVRRGDASKALADFKNSLKHAQKVASRHPESADAGLTLVRAHAKLGDFYVDAYRQNRQDAHYRERAQHHAKLTVELYESLVKDLPDDTGTHQDLALAYMRMGTVIVINGDAADAIPWYEKAEAILDQILELTPSSLRTRRNLGAVMDRIMVAQKTLGQIEEALGTGQKATAIVAAIVQDAPGSLRDQATLMGGHYNLSLVFSDLKRWDEAHDACQKSLEIGSKLAKLLPNDLPTQFGLSEGYRQLSWIQFNRNEVDKSIASRQRAIAIQTQLAEDSPNNGTFHARLATDFELVAEWNRKLARNDQAIQILKSGIQLSESLSTRTSDVAKLLKMQLILRFQLGLTYQESRNYEAAAVEFQHAIDAGQKTLNAGLNDSPTRINLAMAEHYSGRIKLILDTLLGDFEQLLKQPQEQLPAMLNFRADEFIHRKQFAAAAQAAKKVRDLKTANAAQRYNSACHLCLCAASAQAADQKEAWIADAIANLKSAIDAGFDDFDHMRTDKDLKVVWDLPEFKALLPETE